MPNALYDHFKNFSSNSMTFAEKKQVWLEISDMTEDEFDRMMAEEKAGNHWCRRSATSPRILPPNGSAKAAAAPASSLRCRN